MAKYIVEDVKTSKFEKNYKFPLINLIPAIVWGIPVYQKMQPVIGTAGAYGAVAGFLILYITLSYLPIAALIPAIASLIILPVLWSSFFVTLLAKKISLFDYAATLASCGVA